MIEYIRFINFRNLIDITIEPSSYINLIEGENGQGKSSILQGIKYLLTDELDEKISDYVRWGQDKFIIESKFSFNGHTYEYNIEGSKSAKKELIIDGSEIFKNSEATKKMNEIIDSNIIRYANIAEQGKNTQILFEKNTERLKHLKEILGIDKLIPIIEEMKEEEKVYERQVDESNKEIKILEERQYNFIDVPEVQDIEQIKNQFDLLEKDKQLYESHSKLYEKYLQEEQNYVKAQSTICDNEVLISNHKSKIDELNKSQIKYNHTESEDELREQLSNYEKAKIEQDYKVDNYNKTQKRVKELNTLIEQQKQELEKYQLRRLSVCKYNNDDITETEKNLTENRIDLNNFEKELRLAEQGKCPTCGKDYICDMDYLKSEIGSCKSEIKHFESVLKEIKIEFERYNNEINEQELIKVRRQSVQDKIDSYIKELNTLNELDFDEESINNLCDYNSMIKEIKDKLENRKQVVAYNVKISDEVKEFENKIKVCQSLIEQVKDIKKPESVVEPVKYDINRYDILNKEIIIHEQKVKEKERIEKHNQDIQDEKDKDKDRVKVLQKDIDSLSYQVQLLKESRYILDKEFSAYLIDKGALFIKEKMNEFFQRVYGRYEITFQQDKNSIDFFYGDGETISPVGTSSGSERDILALGFRISLASLNSLGFMIFDEVDSQLSNDKAVNLYNIILEGLRDEQLFIISHCEDVKEFVLQQRGSKSFEMKEGLLLN